MAWGVVARVLCVVGGVVLMAIALKARLSHDPLYGSGMPAQWLNRQAGALSIRTADGTGTHCEVFYTGEMEDRRILGSVVPRYRWEILKQDPWVFVTRPVGSREFQEHSWEFSDVLQFLNRPDTRVWGGAEFSRSFRMFGPRRGEVFRRWMYYPGRPGVTTRLARVALEKAGREYERDSDAWVSVPSVSSSGAVDVIVVTTELDYPSVWVHAGQFLTVHPWVFGAGAVLFGGGAVWLFVPRIVAARRGRKGRCRRCGYALVGIAGVAGERGERIVVCPECGTVEGASKPGSSEGRL